MIAFKDRLEAFITTEIARLEAELAAARETLRRLTEGPPAVAVADTPIGVKATRVAVAPRGKAVAIRDKKRAGLRAVRDAAKKDPERRAFYVRVMAGRQINSLTNPDLDKVLAELHPKPAGQFHSGVMAEHSKPQDNNIELVPPP